MTRSYGSFRTSLNAASLIAILAFNAWIAWAVVEGSYSRIFSSPIAPTAFGLDDDGRYLELRKLRDSYDLKGPIFNDYNIGSLLEYQLYPERAYCDNRPEAFPEPFWTQEYEPALGLGPAWQDISMKRGFNMIIASTTGVKENFISRLMGDHGWTLVYLDEFCGAWVKEVPENRRIMRECAFGNARIAKFARKISEDILSLDMVPWYRRNVLAESIILRIYGLTCIGQHELAWPYVWQMHLIYPDHAMLYELIRITAPMDKMSEVEKSLSEKARWPLSSVQVTSWAGHLAATGRKEEARKVLLRGRFFFPFSENILARLDSLDRN